MAATACVAAGLAHDAVAKFLGVMEVDERGVADHRLTVEAGEPLGGWVHRGDGAGGVGSEDGEWSVVDQRLGEAMHLLDLLLAGAFG